MNLFIVDAETDGLYGKVIAIGAIVVDGDGVEIDRFGGKIKGLSPEMLSDEWTKENVLPVLDDDLSDFVDRDTLMEGFWSFWNKHRKNSICIADVQYPVEAGLFRKCIEKDLKTRMFEGPYPLMDLSTLLFVKGIDPLADRCELSGLAETGRHNPFEDAKMTAIIWRKYHG